MPITVPAGMRSEAERPHSSAQWIWLMQLTVVEFDPPSVTQQQVMRLSTYHQDLQWPVGDPFGAVWNPFPFEVGNLELSGEGNLPQLDVSMANATRWPMQYLHATDGLVGRAVTLYLLTEAGLDIAYPNHESLAWDFVVAAAMANEEQVTLRLARPNFFQRQAPQDRFVASRCRWRFGSDQCSYIVNAVAAHTTCDKTLTHCVARGDDEVARNMPRLHPLRFGGFPGLPQQRQT